MHGPSLSGKQAFHLSGSSTWTVRQHGIQVWPTLNASHQPHYGYRFATCQSGRLQNVHLSKIFQLTNCPSSFTLTSASVICRPQVLRHLSCMDDTQFRPFLMHCMRALIVPSICLATSGKPWSLQRNHSIDNVYQCVPTMCTNVLSLVIKNDWVHPGFIHLASTLSLPLGSKAIAEIVIAFRVNLTSSIWWQSL